MKYRLIVLTFILIINSGCAQLNRSDVTNLSNEDKTEALYESFVQKEHPNKAQLDLFLYKMPKGGDIHHHFSGSIYVESFLEWVDSSGYFINKQSLKIDTVHGDDSITVAQLKEDNELYRQLLTLWSDMDYSNHYHTQVPPDSNFFNTFGYFSPVSSNFDDGLKILKKRAQKENISYIETMIKSVGYGLEDTEFDKKSVVLKDTKQLFELFDEVATKIESDPSFSKKVDEFIQTVKTAHNDIDDETFTMRYQTYAYRDTTPSDVFSALYAAFKAAENSELLVGVNIVGPENGYIAIRDYSLHMQMFSYLKNKFPSVNRALHAGELRLGMVRPKNLTFHINEALNVAGAQRIGHGVDLPYEENSLSLLNTIKKNSAIEINFTSNEFILGVKGQKHPYLVYSAVGVPLVICTDDSGVSRNNLTNEYAILTTRYKPSYKVVKSYAYNSIKYSFLSDELKEKLSKDLDKRFKVFESEMAGYYEDIEKSAL